MNTTIPVTTDRFKTILVITIGFMALAWIFNNLWLEKFAFFIGALALLIPATTKWIEWTWFKVAHILGWINTKVLLSIVYFVFLMPVALLARIFVRDPLMLEEEHSPTLYVTRDHLYKREDMENIW